MRTILYDQHCALGAHFVDFGGWEMPLQYTSILEEHHAVRDHAGLFDVSHMGRIAVEGIDAEPFLNHLAANSISNKSNGSATYTVLCAANGTSIDDTIIYRRDKEHFFLIVNAANRQKDLQHLLSEATSYNLTINPKYDEEGILAIQGPASTAIIHELFPDSLSLNNPMHFISTPFQNCSIFLATTGYTGSGGYEIYAPLAVICKLWKLLLDRGASYSIRPVGLGARNTLRLEMGYALYGHELSDSIYPIESVAAWSVKLDKADFIGKSALIAIQNSPSKRYAGAIRLLGAGVMRDGYLLFKQNKKVGYVTSGGYSPSLNQSIGLILTDRHYEHGDQLQVQIRKQLVDAEVVPLPFLRPNQLRRSK